MRPVMCVRQHAGDHLEVRERVVKSRRRSGRALTTPQCTTGEEQDSMRRLRTHY
jgi:hypothetical protein